MTRIDKAGAAPVISPHEVAAWVTKWAEHGRSRLALTTWMAKARNLLAGLRDLRSVLERLEDTPTPQAAALKADVEANIELHLRAGELVLEQLQAEARRASAPNLK